MTVNFTITGDEPLSLSYVKNYLKVDSDDTTDDALISDLITAARQVAEQRTNLHLVARTVVEKLDFFFPKCIELRHGPVGSVTSIQYIDKDGNTQTLGTSIYQVVNDAKTCRIVEAYDQEYPSVREQMEAITITYVTDPGTVSEAILSGMRLLIARLYDYREDWVAQLPTASDIFFNVERVYY